VLCLPVASSLAQTGDAVYQLVVATYTLDPEGSDLRIVTTDAAPVVDIAAPDASGDWFFATPSFSPFGDSVVYMALSRETNAQLYVYGDGNISRPLIDDPDDNYEHPVYSPDGAKIAFVATTGGEGETDLFVVDADGSNIVQLTATADIGEFYPVWSPDGSSLAFMTTDFPEVRIFTLPASGGEPRVVHETEMPPTSLAWSPDGRLYFSAQAGEDDPNPGSAIYAVAADGAGDAETIFDLTASDTGAGIDRINFSPDGDVLAYLSTEYVLGADGTIAQRSSIHVLTIATGEDVVLPLDFGSAFVTGFDWR
jgi:Tol biopolymer transport system component